MDQGGEMCLNTVMAVGLKLQKKNWGQAKKNLGGGESITHISAILSINLDHKELAYERELYTIPNSH